jgi:GcrA cell cycle regulator
MNFDKNILLKTKEWVDSMAKGTWTDERVELLKKLWDSGKTAADIAQQLGENITRNAVIGKAHRLGLSGRSSPIQRKSKKTQANTPSPKPKMGTEAHKEQVRLHETANKPKANGGVGLIELKDRMCHWPIGDPKKPGFHFCGDRNVPGVPYCAEHAAIAYQTSAKKFAVNAKDIDNLAGNSGKSEDALAALDDALNI